MGISMSADRREKVKKFLIDEYLKIQETLQLSSKERNKLFCELIAKESLGLLTPPEIAQLATIQAEREVNGEVEATLKDWDENPDYFFSSKE